LAKAGIEASFCPLKKADGLIECIPQWTEGASNWEAFSQFLKKQEIRNATVISDLNYQIPALNADHCS